MRRRFVTTTAALVLALAPAVLLSQQQPAAQPPAEQQQQQQPTGQQPAQEQQQAAETKEPGLAFAAESGMVFNQIKPDQTAVFEESMARLKEALQKSTDPVRKQQAASWKVFKAAEPMGSNVLYVFLMDPAVKGADYEMFKILQEGLGDATAREVFAKLREAYAAGQNVINMTLVTNMGGM